MMRKSATSPPGTGMNVSRRWGIRSLAVIAVTVGALLALATTASAETRVFVPPHLGVVQLECLQKGGVWIAIPAATPGGLPGGVCVFPDGGTWICQDNFCTANTPRKNVQALLNDIRDVGGRSVREPSDHSKVWVQTGPTNINTVGGMQEAGCRHLRGEFVSIADGAVGQCRTPTATVVCQNVTTRNTCSGFADTPKHAASTRKEVTASIQTSSTTTPGGSTATTTPATSTPGGSTTTTGATTTTTTPPQRR
jgi:hypothetical protein